MVELLKKIIPKKFHQRKFLLKINKRFRDIYRNSSYSQEGEDMILKRIFETQKTGFFVDVGAHHPKRFSNTYAFYKTGWSGINIDAMPGSMKIFNKQRKSDINIEALVSDIHAEINYFSFKESALNTINKELAKELSLVHELLDVYKLHTKTLAEILNEYLPENTTIDFLTIDVEGADFEVLKSNDWNKYKPKFILIEIRNKTLIDISGNPISLFLKDFGYEIFAKTINTVFFKQAK